MAKERFEIEEKYKWDLTKIYENEAAYNSDFALVEELAREYPKHEGRMLKSAKGLYEALSDMQKIERKIEKLWCYAYLTFATDTSVNSAQGRVGNIRSLANKANSASWFVSPSLIKLDEKTVSLWYKECPELKTFERMWKSYVII